MSDIRKWFMKQHDKSNDRTPKPAKPVTAEKPSQVTSQLDKPVHVDQESSGRRKTSKHSSEEKQKPKEEKGTEELSTKESSKRVVRYPAM